MAVDPIYAAAAAGQTPIVVEAWTAACCYLLQLYFDFSGVSDVALGIGLMVGLRLPINFYSPLKARSASSYFDRWHISLVMFIRTYIFTPLYTWFRKRAKGRAASRTMQATAAATLISLTAVGWCHGARPTYVLSGMLAGAVAVGFQLAAFYRPGAARPPTRFKIVAGHVAITGVVALFMVLFRSDSLETAGRMYGALVGLGGGSGGGSGGAALLPPLAEAGGLDALFHLSAPVSAAGLLVAAAATILVFAAPNSVQIFDLYDHPGAPGRPARPARLKWRRNAAWLAATALLFALCIAQAANGTLGTTIYARFSYALAAAAAAAALLAPVAALNLAMDPYGAADGARYRLRAPGHDDVADRTPDAGATARLNLVARSSAPILLLGTSRVQQGFDTDAATVFNGGQSAAAFEDQVRIMTAAARRPVPPRAYLLELPVTLSVPAWRRPTIAPSFPDLGERLLATSTTHVSLHLLANHLWSSAAQRADFFLPMERPARPVRPQRLSDADIRPAFTPEPNLRARLAGYVSQAAALCARAGARLILYEAPVHPDRVADARIASQVVLRVSA